MAVWWSSSRGHGASISTQNRRGPRAIARRFCSGVTLALAMSLLALSPVGAQKCHEMAQRVAPVAMAGMATAAETHRTPAAPAMHSMPQHQPPVAAVPGEATIGSCDCCGETGGHEGSCPSCPAGTTCGAHGSLTAFDAGQRAAASAHVSTPAPSAAGQYPDSWSGNLDTPPPRS